VKAAVDAGISLLQAAGPRRPANLNLISDTDSGLDERPETATKPAGLHPEHGGAAGSIAPRVQ